MAKRGKGAAIDSLMNNMGLCESQDATTKPDPVPEPISTTDKTPRSKRRSYQIWVPEEEYATWKAYQVASAELPKREDLGLSAIREYIRNHPLTDEELIMYNMLLKREGITG